MSKLGITYSFKSGIYNLLTFRTMKKLLLISALLFSFNSTLAQNIDKLKKRELKELANTQKKQLEIKNSKIDDQNTIIKESYETNIRLIEKNNRLTQIKIQLEDFKLSSIESINKLNTENAIIPGLENEIIKLTDSISSINNLLSTYVSRDSSSINQNFYGFLNNLYIGNSKIENQTFRLVPVGVIANNNHVLNSGEYGYEKTGLSQFISIDELKFGIQKRKKTRVANYDVKWDYKQFIKGNYKVISANKFYSFFAEISPTFSFVKGKLLTITNENDSKDYLFSIKQKGTDKSLEGQLGQKGIYFSLTDDDEKEYLLELIVINDEGYLRINNKKSRNNNSLEQIGMKWSVSNEYESVVARYREGYNKQEYDIDYSGRKDYLKSYSGNENSFYLECDKTYISPILIPTIYESEVSITPEMFLFKLEEIQ